MLINPNMSSSPTDNTVIHRDGLALLHTDDAN
jgi:hypothetical protein